MFLQRCRGLRLQNVGNCARIFSSVANRATANLAIKNNNWLLADKVEQQHGENMLLVHWKDKSVSRFPYIYLRDLCNCSKCVNQKSLERLSDTVQDIPLNIRARSVDVSQEGETIHVEWPDHHKSEFESSHLYSKRLLETQERDDKLSTTNLARKGVRFWNRSDMQDNVARFNFGKIMSEDSSLFEWLEKLHFVGIALVEDVPAYTDVTACERLARRVGYIKSTHYG